MLGEAMTTELDVAEETKKFHETKAGVKGLVDSGIHKIPQIFVHLPDDLPREPRNTGQSFDAPIIDLQGFDGERRKAIVEEIRKASESWGFFQMVNHGVPLNILDEMIEGVRKFHEQPLEEKQKIYSLDPSRKVRFFSSRAPHLNQAAVWRDTLGCTFFEGHLDPEELPPVCREIIMEYLNYVITLRDTLSELLSEALSLSSDYLRRLECIEPQIWMGIYCPPCPEPNKTLATAPHADPNFLTLLLQDQIGGLQVLYQNQWVDIPPKKGAILANVGDLLQLITNDKFKSVAHRVVMTMSASPRISAATFFSAKSHGSVYAPIKELLSIDNPPKYGETSTKDFVAFFRSNVLEGKSRLTHLKL